MPYGRILCENESNQIAEQLNRGPGKPVAAPKAHLAVVGLFSPSADWVIGQLSRDVHRFANAIHLRTVFLRSRVTTYLDGYMFNDTRL